MSGTNPFYYNPNNNRSYNQWTRTHDDVCEYENQLSVGTKPMRYYINDFNTPQVNQFIDYTTVGNKKVYNVQNEYQAPLPTRLNSLQQTYVPPYSTTPFLGNTNPSMMYTDTESNLRNGADLRNRKSAVGLNEIEQNRWDFVSAHTVQNAGQFGGSFQSNAQGIDRDGFFDYKVQNNVIFANSAWPNGGISSRNQMRNFIATNGC